MGGQLIKVKFYGDQLWGYRQDDDVFVGVKPIVEGMGLAWNGQLERLKRDPILNEGMRITRIPSSGGDQEAVCLRLHLVPGWLSGVDANRVKPDLRDKVILYQRECYDVLAVQALAQSNTEQNSPPCAAHEPQPPIAAPSSPHPPAR